MQAVWNLISGISTPVSYTDIVDPEGIVIPGTLFGFGESYEQADELEPGKAYWLRTTDSGEIHLGSNLGARVLEAHNPDNMNSITVRGMTLYFGVEVDETERLQYSLPPKPPAGAFDVRFKDGWRLVKDYGEVELINDDNFLKIAYNVVIDTGGHMNWILTSDNGKDYILKGAGEHTISSSERFILDRKSVTPIPFTLHQNHPNPFNPITTIRYGLPSDALVTLSIYDMLGREIARLVNTNQEAGSKSVQWNATDTMGRPVGAGVYLYKIQAGEFVQTRKMFLLK